MSKTARVRYLIFDVEAVGDGELIANAKYGKENLDAATALKRFRAELIEQTGKDVLPPTYVLPISVAIAKVSDDFELLDLTVLDEPKYRPHLIVEKFWAGWRHYDRPTLVTFNGRGYDLPVLELAAFRYGIPLPDWFNVYAKTYDQSRNRYNMQSHLDLMDLFSNFGASRVTGGLNLLANLIGKPGKTSIDGSQVQDLYDAGQAGYINDYCRCDVLDTYFVFLRSRVLLGMITLNREHELVTQAREWLEARRSDIAAFDHYLNEWGDWNPPTENENTAPPTA